MTNIRIRIISLAVIVLSAAPFAAAGVNLSGEYWFGSLSADASTNVPWAKRGTVVVTGNNWTQEWADYDGNHIFSSTFTTAVQSDGSININLSSGFYNVAWNGNVMIHADTAPDANNRLGVDIITRKATNVDVNDLVGEYRFFDHWLGWDDRYDGVGWGNGQFDANGTIVDTWVNSDGNTETYTSTWTLDEVNGIGYITGFPHPFLLGKGGVITVFRPTTDINPDIGYTLIIKKTDQNITPAEMADTYQVRFLESGPGGVPYTCGRGICVIDSNGMMHVDAYYSDGEHDVFDANYTLGPGNKFSISSAPEEGVISPDLGLIFIPEYVCSNPRNSYDWIGGIFLIRMPGSGPPSPPDIADLNGDGVVDWADLEILISHWLDMRDTNNGMWTWVSGPNMPDQNGVYGTKGVADHNNMPRPRNKGVSWIDASGNLWLFGGRVVPSYSLICLNDLWKFDGVDWTWVSGSNDVNQSGIYGTKGVASPGNVPGARSGSVSWTDYSGNFWLFGGWGRDIIGRNTYINDLWKYNLSSGLWTWVSGSNYGGASGVYGTKGVAAPSNVPGSREGSISWIDNDGNMWLFGGVGSSSSEFGDLNDLWKYSPSSGLWTWVSGSNLPNKLGVYGTKGVAEPNNGPGARRDSVSWIDDSGNLWLFGGKGYGASGGWVNLNDLWKFDPSSGLWTWVSGSIYNSAPTFYGVYGTKGMAASANVPGARSYSVSWIDGNNNLWLFGGWGSGESGDEGELNDLWKFGYGNPIGDLNGDGIVNFEDYAILVSQWLPTAPPTPPIVDLNGDCIVNFEDFALMARWWLTDCDISNNWCDGADLDKSGNVDTYDIEAIANQWLSNCNDNNNVTPPDIVWISINDPGVAGHEVFNSQMSKYETTNSQYCQFLNAALASGDVTVSGNYVKGENGSNSGADFAGQRYYYLTGSGVTDDGAINGGAAKIHYSGGVFSVESGFENYPVTYVSWYGATAFCNYYGYRLPTEWEWQAVADYDGSYIYGCGASINNNIANYFGSTHPNGITAVGTFGTYGYGMCDLAGNVLEWTSTVYDLGGYVIRGGSWRSSATFYDCNVSGRAGATTDHTGDGVGFRVCR